MNGPQALPSFSDYFTDQEEKKKELEPDLRPFSDYFKEEPMIPEIVEPEKENFLQKLQSMASKLFPGEKPPETVPMGGGLLKEVAPPEIQERMAEPTREAYRPKLEQALRYIAKPTVDILHGGTEAAAALGTGIPSFLAGATTQTAETLFNVLKDAYNSWKVGFKNVETFAPKPVARYLLETAGKSTSLRDWISKQAELWQPKTKMGEFMTGTSIAPIVAYMAGVEEVAKLTSDDPNIQRGVTYLGDIALIFAVPKAKAYVKNQMRTKAPVITSKLKGMLIESDKVPVEMKRKIMEVPDTIPEELEALLPRYEKGERIGVPREEIIKPKAPEIKKVPVEKEFAKLSDKPGKSPLFEAIRAEGGIDGKALKRAKGSGPASWNELREQGVPMNVFQNPKTKGTGKLGLDEMAERIAKRHPELMRGEGDEALAQSMIDEMTRKPEWGRSEKELDLEETERVGEEAKQEEYTADAIRGIVARSKGGKVKVGVVDVVRKEKLPWLSNKDIAKRLEYEGVKIVTEPERKWTPEEEAEFEASEAARIKEIEASPEQAERLKWQATEPVIAQEVRKARVEEIKRSAKKEAELKKEIEELKKPRVAEVREAPPPKMSIKEIEKAIAEGKELTADQKKYLRAEGVKVEEIKEFKPKPLPEERAEEFEPGVARKKDNLVRVSIVTPTGEIEPLGKFPEREISRIKNYAKTKGLSDKVVIGKPAKEAWPEQYGWREHQRTIEKRIDELKKVPKEQWAEWQKKHAGYPMTEEVKKVVDRIQQKRGLKKRVKLEELKAELQKTDAGKVEWNFIEQEMQLKELKKPTYRKAIAKLEHTLVDTSGNIKRKLINELGWRGQTAAMEKNLAAGASSWATHLIEEAESVIYKGVSKADEIILNRYLQSARTVAIHKYKPEVKRPGGLYDEHLEWQKDITPEIKQAGDRYFKAMRDQLDELHKGGLITADEVKYLKSKGVYEKTKFIQYIDPKNKFNIGGTEITVPDSGIKALKEGSESAMELDSRLLLKEVITRTQGRLSNARANRTLYVLAKEVPDNGIVRLAKVVGKTKKGILKYETTPSNHTKIKTFIEGKPVEMIMPDEYAREWIKRDPLVSQNLAQLTQWLSGNKILKAMATGINPGFAVTNLPRDIAHIFLTTDIYSKHLPAFGPQMLKDLMETKHDAFHGTGEWINYLRQGGGMNWLTFQGRMISGRAGTKLARLQEFLGKAGEVSERWTRLALRNRAIKEGYSPVEATAIARDYLDFYQGGSVVKAFDQGIPYLNAGIQGTRGITRAISRAPGKTSYKIAQIMTLAAGLYWANNAINKECMDHVSPTDKRMSFIITTPFHWKDKKGNERYLFIKIAKDQGQRIFCSLTENVLNKLTGRPVNIEEVTGSAQDAIQILPLTSLPPTVSAILGYMANKDWWQNKDIWKGAKVKAGEEKTLYAHPALEKAGKAGLSPERLNYALQQIFTRGNIYTSIVSGGVGFLVGGVPEKDKGKILAEIVTRLPIVRRVFELTPPYSPKELKEQEKATVEENTRKQRQKLELNKMANTYYRELYDKNIKDKPLLNEIKSYILDQPKTDHARLKTWFKNYGSVYNIPERSWWLQLMNQSPEVRAHLFYTKYVESDEKKRKEMVALARKLPSITSERFNSVFNALWREHKKAVK